MAGSYIPRQDAAALAWMRTFASGIESSPSEYAVTASDAVAIRNAVDAFGIALGNVSDPETKTRVSVLTKKQAREAAESICRRFASIIKVNQAVSDTNKIAIGVRPLNRERTRIDCPQSSPLISVIGCTPGAQIVRYRDTWTPQSSAKPFGATELQLFVAISDEAFASRDEAKLVGKFTKNPVSVKFTAPDGGKRATYYGRWVSRRGETGPWSVPVSLHIAA